MESKANHVVRGQSAPDLNSYNRVMDKFRVEYKNYINSDFTYINLSNFGKYKDDYSIIKELVIVAIERSFSINRSEWITINAYQKAKAIIKSRSWYCFFLSNYFNVSISIIAKEMNLTRSGVKHYISNVAEDFSQETKNDYNKVLQNIFKTDSELKYGW